MTTPSSPARRRTVAAKRLSFGVLVVLLSRCPGTGCEPPDHRPDVAIGVITADDTAQYIPAGGDPIDLLEDGPGSAAPSTVAVTPDGRRAWVTECCEPVWGRWWEIDVGVGPVDPLPGTGYHFDLDPSGRLLTSLGYFGVAIRDLDGEIVAGEFDLNALPVPRDPYDTAWIADGRVAFLELVQPATGNEFRLVVTDAALSGYRDAVGLVIATNLEAPWPRLAGVDADGRIMVVQADDGDDLTDTIHAYDPISLERVPAADVRLPRRASSAWVDGDHMLWIDAQDRLTVDGERIRGRYTWARSA